MEQSVSTLMESRGQKKIRDKVTIYLSPITTRKRLNTVKKVVAITINVVVIGVIATTKKSMQAVVINSEAIDLCNTRFSLQ